MVKFTAIEMAVLVGSNHDLSAMFNAQHDRNKLKASKSSVSYKSEKGWICGALMPVLAELGIACRRKE